MRNLLVAISRNPVSLAGAAITTTSALLILTLFPMALLGAYTLNLAAKENARRPLGRIQRILPMDHADYLASQRPLGVAAAGILLKLPLKPGNVLAVQQCEKFQIRDHIRVIRVEKELVEPVRRCLLGIKRRRSPWRAA